jgi:hypothetical protein
MTRDRSAALRDIKGICIKGFCIDAPFLPHYRGCGPRLPNEVLSFWKE